METVVEADLDDPGCSLRRSTELFDLLRPESRWFFDEHVRACVESLGGKGGELVVGRCDDHDLGLELEQVFEALAGARPEIGCKSLRGFPEDIGAADELIVRS